MALTKRGKHRFGESQGDIRVEILRYSKTNAYLAQQFADSACSCGGGVFQLSVDEDEGAAVRTCVLCGREHPIGDSGDYLQGAQLDDCECPCGGEAFEITVGVSLYDESEDVRWLYLGCRCPACGLTAVNADWKNEFNGYQRLLAQI